MDIFLRANGWRLNTSTADAERMILAVAASQASREQLTAWVKERAIAPE